MLRNLIDKQELKAKLAEENIKRTTISFYRYVKLQNAPNLRDKLYAEWQALMIFGRIYLAEEGINAQLSVPTENLELLRQNLESYSEFKSIPFKIAVEDDGKSFYKLTIKTKSKIVADGINDANFDSSKVGKHLSAEEFNQALDDPKTITVDMRNQYESEVGHFKNAICPDVDTFREELVTVKKILHGKEEEKILLYCTGGIRCEKASAYLKHHGFKNVNQLYGGIIQYAHEIKAKKLASKFRGKNFVFDERVGERISAEIISHCHQCQNPCDDHTNCKNDDCHLLFIQCQICSQKFNGCCSQKCKEIAALPLEDQIKIRKGKCKTNSLSVYKSRLRPKLSCKQIS